MLLRVEPWIRAKGATRIREQCLKDIEIMLVTQKNRRGVAA